MGPFWTDFAQIQAKMTKTKQQQQQKICQFLNIPIIYHRSQNQKKLTSQWTDRQTDNGYFIGPSVGWGSNY